MRTNSKKSVSSDSRAVAKLKNLKAMGYSIASATVYHYGSTLFFCKEDMQEYLESLRG